MPPLRWRFLAAVLLASWIAPQAAATAVALHVILDHEHGGPVPVDAGLHGHLHAEGVPHHSHDVVFDNGDGPAQPPRQAQLTAQTPGTGIPAALMIGAAFAALSGAPGPDPPPRLLPLRI